MERATCATMSQPANAARGSPASERPSSFSAYVGAVREARSAGTVPNSSVVNAVIAAVNARMRPSIARSR